MITLLENEKYAFVLSAKTGFPVGLTQVSTWIDGTPMSLQKTDSVSYFQHTNGKYYCRNWEGGTIKMEEYLVADSQTDNAPRWEKFWAYWGQMNNRDIRFHLIIPSGTYYCSRTTEFDGFKCYIENYGAHLYAPDTMGWAFWGRYSGDYRVGGIGLHLISQGRSANSKEGRVACDNGDHLAFINANGISLDMPIFEYNDAQGRRQPQPLRDYLNKPAGTLVQSLNPEHYTSHGCWYAIPIKARIHLIYGFAGNGLFGAGFSAQYQAGRGPDGHNCSYAHFEGGHIRRCYGYAATVIGVDANQIGFLDVDFRESQLAGFMDLSQSGARLWNCKEEVNEGGGFWLCSFGKPSCTGAYSETGTFSANINNNGILEGIINKYTYGAGWTQAGPEVNYAKIRRIEAGTIQQGGTQQLIRYQDASDSNGLAVRTSITGNLGYHSGMEDFLGPGEGSIDGRHAGINTVVLAAENLTPYKESFKGLRLLGKQILKVDGFNPPNGHRHYPGDILENRSRSFTLTGPNRWECITGGLWNTDTYTSIGGPAGTWTSNYQFTLERPTSLLQQGDTILVNGMAIQIAGASYVGPGDAKMAKAISLVQGINFDITKPPVIDLPRARFRAIDGNATGTSSQRPTLRADDAGFTYRNITLGKVELWNGSQFV